MPSARDQLTCLVDYCLSANEVLLFPMEVNGMVLGGEWDVLGGLMGVRSESVNGIVLGGELGVSE